MPYSVIHGHLSEQASSEAQGSNRPVRSQQPPNRLAYYAPPGQLLSTSSFDNHNSALHVPVLSTSFLSIHRCIPSYRLQSYPVIFHMA